MSLAELSELKVGNIILKKISIDDTPFISEMFADELVRKYYIVPKEARQDYRSLIRYWLHDISQGAGYAWIIIEKGSGLFAKNKACGFFAFEYRGNLRNARISYAVRPEYRRKNIATQSAIIVIEALKSLGVTSIEADVDKDNVPSEKIVENLGFSTNKRQALADPEMMREGEIRFRHLWKKDLTLKSNLGSESETKRISLNATQTELIEAINALVNIIESSGQHPHLMSKYFYLLGRIKFNEDNYEEATDAFGQCNMIIMNENLPANHETYYWFARIKELEGKPEDAKMYYGFALEYYRADPYLITKKEIQDALDSF